MIDGHLNLAYNALAAGRDLTLPLGELRRDHPGALVTLPELAEGGVRLVFGTVFVMPAAATMGGFFPNGVNGNIRGGIATL